MSDKSVLEMKMEIDYIVQSLSEVDGFLSGIRLLAHKDQSRELYDLGMKVRSCREKAIDMWQTYSLDDYRGLELLVKGQSNDHTSN